VGEKGTVQQQKNRDWKERYGSAFQHKREDERTRITRREGRQMRWKREYAKQKEKKETLGGTGNGRPAAQRKVDWEGGESCKMKATRARKAKGESAGT